MKLQTRTIGQCYFGLQEEEEGRLKKVFDLEGKRARNQEIRWPRGKGEKDYTQNLEDRRQQASSRLVAGCSAVDQTRSWFLQKWYPAISILYNDANIERSYKYTQTTYVSVTEIGDFPRPKQYSYVSFGSEARLQLLVRSDVCVDSIPLLHIHRHHRDRDVFGDSVIDTTLNGIHISST